MHRRMFPMALAAAALMLGGAAQARPVRAAFIPSGDIADAPSGFVEMCRADPGACGLTDAAVAQAAVPIDATTSSLALYFTSAAIATVPSADLVAPPAAPSPAMGDQDDRALKKLAQRVNDAVNRRTRQQSDLQTYGVPELWHASGSAPGAVGDCEDLALEKRAELLAAGVSAERLLLATVFRSGVGLHTVLVLRRPRGDFVLDSRVGRIVAWRSARYSWLRVQSAANPLEWRRVVQV